MITRFLTCATRHTNKGNNSQWPGLYSVLGQEAHDLSSLFSIFAYAWKILFWIRKTTLNYEEKLKQFLCNFSSNYY